MEPLPKGRGKSKGKELGLFYLFSKKSKNRFTQGLYFFKRGCLKRPRSTAGECQRLDYNLPKTIIIIITKGKAGQA